MNPYIKNLINLISENLTLPVITMVESEIVADCDGRWLSSIGEARVDEYYQKDEDLYFKSKDLEDLKENFIENAIQENEGNTFNSEEFRICVNNYMESIEWTKAIVVNIDLP